MQPSWLVLHSPHIGYLVYIRVQLSSRGFLLCTNIIISLHLSHVPREYSTSVVMQIPCFRPFCLILLAWERITSPKDSSSDMGTHKPSNAGACWNPHCGCNRSQKYKLLTVTIGGVTYPWKTHVVLILLYVQSVFLSVPSCCWSTLSLCAWPLCCWELRFFENFRLFIVSCHCRPVCAALASILSRNTGPSILSPVFKICWSR